MKEESMSKKKIGIRIVSFLILFLIIFAGISEIMQDKRIDGEYNPTTKIRGFYAQKKDNLDFVFLGSSQVYADISPAVLWRDYGITSYDFTANEQPLWITYYYMKEVLKHQKPKAIVVDVFTAYADDYMEEGINHFSIDDMPLSMNKLRAIHEGVPKELRSSYYFSIAKYHNTWIELSQDKVQAAFRYEDDPMKGYSPFVFARAYADSAPKEVLSQKERVEIPERSKRYLDEMIALSKENSVDLIFMKTPNGNAERQMLYNTVDDYCKEKEVPFLNLNTLFDGEAHINCLQAEKVTQYVGEYLNNKYPDLDKRGQNGYEDFEHAAELFGRYRQKCQSVMADSLETYLASIADKKDMLIMVTAKGELAYNAGQKKALQELGFSGDLEDGANYAALMYDGEVLFEKASHEEMEFETTCGTLNSKLGVKLDEDAKTSCYMKINDHNCSIDLEGFNIVVFDLKLDEIYELISFDGKADFKAVRK